MRRHLSIDALTQGSLNEAVLSRNGVGDRKEMQKYRNNIPTV